MLNLFGKSSELRMSSKSVPGRMELISGAVARYMDVRHRDSLMVYGLIGAKE